jgi:hypothetical protein
MKIMSRKNSIWYVILHQKKVCVYAQGLCVHTYIKSMLIPLSTTYRHHHHHSAWHSVSLHTAEVKKIQLRILGRLCSLAMRGMCVLHQQQP